MNKLESLTEKQREVLEYLIDYRKKNGWYPTLREIAKHFEITRHSVEQRLYHLEYKGYIERIFNKPRGIKILDEDD